MVFHGPRYSQAFDNESSHYDSALDSPTIRSSVSTQQVEEDIVHIVDERVVQSAPRDEHNLRQSYSEPYISYDGQDDRSQDRYENRYERERDHYDGRVAYDGEDSIERASRPGYKPQGQPVKYVSSDK